MPRIRKKKKSSGSTPLTRADLRELELFAENDYPIYRQMQAFALNYAKKKVAGKYNRTLAIKGLANNLIPNIISKYKKNYGGYYRVSASDKKKLAQMLLRNVTEMRDYIIKHEPHKLPKKYQKKPTGKLAKKTKKRKKK